MGPDGENGSGSHDPLVRVSSRGGPPCADDRGHESQD